MDLLFAPFVIFFVMPPLALVPAAVLGLELPGVVDSSATPVLDVGYRTVVNGQFYWTSGRAELEVFREAPYKYTGLSETR